MFRIVLGLLLLVPAAQAVDAHSLTAKVQAARIGNPIEVSANGFHSDAGYAFAWSASTGKIEGDGATVKYTAEKPGWSVVSVKVSKDKHEIWSREIPLFAFKQFVILKADDLCQSQPGRVKMEWLKLVLYLAAEHVKCSIGIITQCLAVFDAGTLRFLKEMEQTGMVEFFHHGWDHATLDSLPPTQKPDGAKEVKPPPTVLTSDGGKATHYFEFRGTPYEYQKQHLDDGFRLAKEKLGITMHAFGAPSNETDDTTVKVVDENADIQVVFYKCKGSKKLVIPELVKLETEKGVPDLASFKKQYEANRDKECLALQFHPREATFNERFYTDFAPAVEFMQKDGATFITPTDYYRFVKEGLAPISPLEDSDADGLNDGEEPSTDPDNDGLPCFLDADSNNNGTPDGAEQKAGKAPFQMEKAPPAVSTSK